MPKEKINFSKAFKELEEITESFEKENVDLDQGLAKFERGLELAKTLGEKLEEVENRVETIKRRFKMEEKEGGEQEDIEED